MVSTPNIGNFDLPVLSDSMKLVETRELAISNDFEILRLLTPLKAAGDAFFPGI